jgi:hypothetical protein
MINWEYIGLYAFIILLLCIHAWWSGAAQSHRERDRYAKRSYERMKAQGYFKAFTQGDYKARRAKKYQDRMDGGWW